MIGRTTLLLLATGFLLLAGLGLSGYLLARGMEARRRVQARIEGVVRPLLASQAVTRIPITRAQAPDRGGLISWAAWCFGFSPEAPHRYPMRWWVVLPLTLTLARLGCELVSGLLGAMSLLLLPVLWVLLARSYFGWCEGRLRRRLLGQMPDALAMIVRAVRVGIPVTEAIHAAARESQAPTASEFATLHDQLLIGVPLDEGLEAMGQRTGLSEYRFFATAVALQQQTGGGLSELLENLADVIRRRIALQSRGYALSSEARTSALVLSVMPVLTGAMMWVINPDYIDLLFRNPTGESLLGAAVLSLATGVLAMRAIIRKTLA